MYLSMVSHHVTRECSKSDDKVYRNFDKYHAVVYGVVVVNLSAVYSKAYMMINKKSIKIE